MTPGIRPGQDADADAIIRLIGDCWAEYPGCVLDVDGELPELRALASFFAAAGGALWVAADGTGINGMVGVRPGADTASWEICRLYVAHTARGAGLAHALMDLAEGHARAAGSEALMLWTDTRFLRSHNFYEKRGYLRQGPLRVLDDISRSLEFRYAKPARGLVSQSLDAAGAASGERALARLLHAWGSPGPGSAGAAWQGVSAGVAQGRRALMVAWIDGELVGAAQLGVDERGAPPHRAAMEALLLAPNCDRSMVAHALLGEAEAAGLALGKRLLTAEWPADDPLAAAFHGQGWQCVGRIPGGVRGASGAPADSLVFCKALTSGFPVAEALDVGR